MKDGPTHPAGARNPDTAAKSPPCRFQVLEVRLTGTTLTTASHAILNWALRAERRYVCIFAVDSVLQCHNDAELARIANASDMTLTDGMPLVWLGRHAAHLPIDRCYGPDLMLHTITEGCPLGIRHYFYGGTDETVLARLEACLKERFPDLQIAGSHCPPHRPLTPEEREAVVRDINASQADIVWVGIGTPKQDYWVGGYRNLLKAPVLVAVGAAFNFHSGAVPQAPRWMMRCGLEWVFRLIAEPRRLWRRYLIGNPRFTLLVLRQWLTGKPVPLGQVFSPPC